MMARRPQLIRCGIVVAAFVPFSLVVLARETGKTSQAGPTQAVAPEGAPVCPGGPVNIATN
jgi:hypothetical protein